MPKRPPLPLGSAALNLWQSHATMRKSSCRKAIADLAEIKEAYSILLELAASAVDRVQDGFTKTTYQFQRVEAILAGYLSGVTLVEHAILSGYNIQAATLVRQEYEAIAALEEIVQGLRIEGKTPNVRYVQTVPPSIYGSLSKAAHFADTDALQMLGACQTLPGDAPPNSIAWLLSPQYLPTTTKRIFGLHTLLLGNLVVHQSNHYSSLHGISPSERELESLDQAITLLKGAGIVESVA